MTIKLLSYSESLEPNLLATTIIERDSDLGKWMLENKKWPEVLLSLSHGYFQLEEWNGAVEAEYVKTSGFSLP